MNKKEYEAIIDIAYSTNVPEANIWEAYEELIEWLEAEAEEEEMTVEEYIEKYFSENLIDINLFYNHDNNKFTWKIGEAEGSWYELRALYDHGPEVILDTWFMEWTHFYDDDRNSYRSLYQIEDDQMLKDNKDFYMDLDELHGC